MSLLGLWQNYKYANILPEEQLLREEGTLHALLLLVNKMSYSKTLGSASSRMQNITRRITPGQNQAMPSDSSSSLSLQQPPGSGRREQRVQGKFRVNTREECLAQPRKRILVLRGCLRRKQKDQKLDFRRILPGRPVDQVHQVASCGSRAASLNWQSSCRKEGRSAAELSRKRNLTRSRFPLSLNAAPLESVSC